MAIFKVCLFNSLKIEEVLPFDLVKRDKRYIEAYIIEAIKAYKKTNNTKCDRLI